MCTGLVSRETVEEHSVLRDYVITRVDGAEICYYDECFEVKRKGVAYVLDRNMMFRDLLKKAEESGVNIIYKRWNGEKQGILIGADGVHSSVRKLFFKRDIKRALAVEGIGKGEGVKVYLGLWSDRFGWNVYGKVGVFGDKEDLKVLSKFIGIDINNVKGRYIPTEPLFTVVKGDVALVGDAAGQTKPTTGGGIRYGLMAADMLASALIEGDLSIYQNTYRRDIYPLLKIHSLIQFFIELFGHRFIFKLGRHLRNYLEQKGSMDDPTFLFSALGKLTYQTFSLLIENQLRPP